MFGERVAERVLRDHGATVLARNVTVGRGEIDLHVVFRGVVVSVEVKTLVAVPDEPSDPMRSYTDAKADQVHRLAREIRPRAQRVDVMAVVVGGDRVDVRWVRNA